jgi:hypothetical protein
MPRVGQLILTTIDEADSLIREALNAETGQNPGGALDGAEIGSRKDDKTKSENHRRPGRRRDAHTGWSTWT